MIFNFLILLFSFLYFGNALASSCCGGNASSNQIIIGDNKYELNVRSSFRTDFGQTTDKGKAIFYDDVTDHTYTTSFDATMLFSDYWQTGLKLAVAHKNIEKGNLQEKQTGLTDLGLQLAHEFLPELYYSKWKPRGFLFLSTNIPFGKNLMTSKKLLRSDIRGNGFYSIGLGTLFVKKMGDYTNRFSMEFQKTFDAHEKENTLKSFHKYLLSFGSSYQLTDFWNLGFLVSWNYTNPKKIVGTINTRSLSDQYFDTSLFANYLIAPESLLGLTYLDSSLLGKSRNSALYRQITINYTYQIPL